MICISVENGSNNTVGESCYSAHQAVSRFVDDHINMVICVHYKCQARAGVSWNFNKSSECVTITDSNFSNWVIIIIIIIIILIIIIKILLLFV